MKRLNLVLAALLCASSSYARLATPYNTDDAWCVGVSGTEVCVDSSGNLLPTTTNDTTLGTASYLWSAIYAYDLSLTDDLVVSDDMTVTDDAVINGKLLVDNDTAADVPIRILGAASQSGDLMLIESVNGTDLVRVKSAGEVLVGVGTPDVTQGEGDLYVASNLEVDATATFDGMIDADLNIDLDIGAAATTGISIMAALSQSADLLHVESVYSTDFIRALAAGGLEVVNGAASPTATIGAGDLYVEDELEVDGTLSADGLVDIDNSIDLDIAAAGSTGISVAAALSQTADLLHMESIYSTDFIRVLAAGGLEVVNGDSSPTMTVGAGDLYVEDEMEVDGTLSADGLVDIDNSIDLDVAAAGTTGIAISAALSQTADLLNIGSVYSTDFIRAMPSGGLEIVNGAAVPTMTVGAGDLYVEDEFEVDGTLSADGLVDIDNSIDLDIAAAASTGISVDGYAAQSADLIIARNGSSTPIIRVTPTGVLLRVLTMAQIDASTPLAAGEIVVVSNRSSTGYGICIATGTALAQYKLLSGTAVETTGCGTGL